MPSIRPRARWAVALLVPAVLAITGCDLISPEEARDTLVATREIKRIQDEEIRPRLNAIDDLQADEIEPREQRMAELSRQIDEIVRSEIEPLEDGLWREESDDHAEPQPGADFEARMREMDEKQWQLDDEERSLQQRLEDEERELRSAFESDIDAKEETLFALHQELEGLHSSIDGHLEKWQADFEARMGELDEKQWQLEDEEWALQRRFGDEERNLRSAFEADIGAKEELVFALRQELDDVYSAYESFFQKHHAELEARLWELDEAQRSLDDLEWALHRELEDDEWSTRDYFETIIHAREELLATLYEQLNALEWSNPTSADGLYEELEWIENELALLEPDSPEADALRHDAEEIELAIADVQAGLTNDTGAIESQIATLQMEIDQLYADTDEELAQTYDAFEDAIYALKNQRISLEEEREDLESQLYGDAFALTQTEFDDDVASLEGRIASAEEAIELFYRDMEGSFRELREGFEHAMASLEASRIELHQERRSLDREGRGGAFSDGDNGFEDEANSVESRIASLQREIELHHSHMEDAIQELHVAVEQAIDELEERRFALRLERRSLEDEVRDHVTFARATFEDGRDVLEEEIRLLYGNEIQPLEDELRQLEVELREFHEQERAFRQELRTVRATIEPMEQQIESRLLDLLEAALAPIAEEATQPSAS